MAKQNKQAASSEQSYKCLMTIRHDGMVYAPGSSIDLTTEQASALVESRAIEAVSSSRKESREETKEEAE